MKYYAVGMLNFTSDQWVQEYLQQVTPMVEKVGGKYLARTPMIEMIEGSTPPPNTIVMIEFPSKDAAEAFYHSDEYAPFKDARQAGSTGTFMLVAGQDIAAP